LLSVIGFSHADYAQFIAALRPHKQDHPHVQKSDRDKSLLAIVAAIIADSQVISFKDLSGARHIQTAFGEGHEALIGVENEFHAILLIQECIFVYRIVYTYF
jgi:hypothetical protein